MTESKAETIDQYLTRRVTEILKFDQPMLESLLKIEDDRERYLAMLMVMTTWLDRHRHFPMF